MSKNVDPRLFVLAYAFISALSSLTIAGGLRCSHREPAVAQPPAPPAPPPPPPEPLKRGDHVRQKLSNVEGYILWVNADGTLRVAFGNSNNVAEANNQDPLMWDRR